MDCYAIDLKITWLGRCQFNWLREMWKPVEFCNENESERSAQQSTNFKMLITLAVCASSAAMSDWTSEQEAGAEISSLLCKWASQYANEISHSNQTIKVKFPELCKWLRNLCLDCNRFTRPARMNIQNDMQKSNTQFHFNRFNERFHWICCNREGRCRCLLHPHDNRWPDDGRVPHRRFDGSAGSGQLHVFLHQSARIGPADHHR